MSIRTETNPEDQAAWNRVRVAITERFPNIDRDQLAECPDEMHALSQFVKQRVHASDEEIDGLIREYAPQESLVERVKHAASERFNQAGESAQFAHMRADDYIVRRPTESVLSGFIAGIIVGASVMALVMRPKPEPPAWYRLQDRTWR